MANIVQSAAIVWDGYDVVTCHFPKPVTAGNVVCVALSIQTISLPAVVAIYDTLESIYSLIFPATAFNIFSASLWAVKLALGGDNTVTIKLSHVAVHPDIRIVEIAGIEVPAIITSNVGIGQHITCNSVVSVNSALIAAVSALGGVTSLGPGWELVTISSDGNILAYQNVTVSESTSFEFSAIAGSGTNWIIQIAAFPENLFGVIQTLSGFTFAQLLSPVLLNDPAVMAAAAALDAEFQAVTACIPQATIFANLDGQSDTVLDYLAYQLHVYAYSVDYTREVKLQLIQNALPFNASIGTVATMQQILTSIFQDCTISEWWQTGELPYTFRVLVSADPGEAGIVAIQEAVLALKPESRAYLGLVVQGVSSQTVWAGATTMHVGESYVAAKPPGFPPLWTPAMGVLKQT